MPFPLPPQGALRRFAAAVLPHAALALAVLLAGRSAAAGELTLAVSLGPVSLPVYVAESKGFFRLEGVDVTTRECNSGRHCIELLADGRADVATAAELLVTLDSLARSELAIVATLSTSHQIRVVARRSSGIELPRHLQGKRIGTAVGTSAEYYLDSWLLFHGIDRAQTTVVPLRADQLAAALQRSEVDAIAIWEPVASAAAEGLGADLAALPLTRVYTQHFALVTERRKLARNEASVAGMLRALARASQLIAREPATARSILKTRLGIDDARATAYLADHNYMLGLDQSLVSTMESQMRWALRATNPPARPQGPNVLRSIEPALLRGAVPGAVTLVQ